MEFIIRKIFTLLVSLLICGVLQISPLFAHAAVQNLIANDSVETASPTSPQLPQGWSTGRWGTNTTSFSYLNNGHNGGRSLGVQMTSYTNGDAKWYFNPVSVTPGSTYTYTDYYMSSARTDVLAAFIDGNGNYTYKYLSSPAASPLTWQQYTKSFTVPAGTAKLTMFHIIYSVGSLQTDDYSLTKDGNTQITITAPGSGQTLSGTVNVTATASDANGISSVQFKLDGQNLGNMVQSDPYNYSWNTATTPNGSHSLTAVATNSLGQTAVSESVPITVNNQQGGTEGSNLLPNSDLETADPASPSRPLNWRAGRWGANTYKHAYMSSGHSSGHSVKTEITQYTDGAAYWYNLDQPVTAGKTYVFSDYYQSNTLSEVDVGVNMSDGTIKYIYLGSAAASPNSWSKFQGQFTAPAGAVSVKIFHEIFSVGWMSVDDYSLTQKDQVQTDSNLVANPSLETPDANNPNKPGGGWTSGSWGANSAALSYVKDSGHSGTSSVKAEITQYTNGAAHWITNTVPVTPGQLYDYSEYYMSNTTTQILAVFKMSDGTAKYVWLGSPFRSPDGWTHFRKQFTAPAGAVSLSMYHELYSVGWVASDDYSLKTFAYEGFNNPIITITDDDGYRSFNKYGLPLLKKYGFSSTDYIITSDPSRGPSYVSDAMIKDLYDNDQEIGSHSVSHPDLSTLSDGQLTSQLGDSQEYLQNLLGISVPNFAAPYGSYNQEVIDNAKKYYRSFRTVNSGYNAKNNFDPYQIMVQNLHSDTTLAEFQSWVDQAKATKTWLVLVYHQVDPDATDTYNTYPADFDAQLNVIKNSGIPVKTVSQALDELIPQLY